MYINQICTRHSIRLSSPADMASSLVILAACVLAAASAAPQLNSKSTLQHQVIRHSYIRPHHVINVQPARGVSVHYSHPVQSYTYSHAPQVTHVTVGQHPTVATGSAITILKQAQDVNEDGAYNFGFETSNGISVQTNAGPLSFLGHDDAIQTVTGSFHYIAPDGTPITTHWIADENGFRAEGDHLPKAPESQ